MPISGSILIGRDLGRLVSTATTWGLGMADRGRLRLAFLRRMDRAFARTIAVSPTEFRARFKTNGAQTCRSSISALSSSPI